MICAASSRTLLTVLVCAVPIAGQMCTKTFLITGNGKSIAVHTNFQKKDFPPDEDEGGAARPRPTRLAEEGLLPEVQLRLPIVHENRDCAGSTFQFPVWIRRRPPVCAIRRFRALPAFAFPR